MRYDIRNSNLINFDGVHKMSEGFERKQIEIKIVYYKSSSKYYDSVCLQCEGMNGYNQVYIPRPQTRVSAKIDQVFRLN